MNDSNFIGNGKEVIGIFCNTNCIAIEVVLCYSKVDLDYLKCILQTLGQPLKNIILKEDNNYAKQRDVLELFNILN